MATSTVGDLIRQALRSSGAFGVGQTPLAEDANEALDACNEMLAQWNNQRWMVYRLEDYSIVSTGAQSYTVGPGGDLNVPVQRPDKISSAFMRQIVNTSPPNQVDYPCEIIEARETYNLIALKQLVSFQSYVFYDPKFPLGLLYPWPIPQAAIYEVHGTFKEQLVSFDSLAQKINLPPEYNAAVRYCLAKRLALDYTLPVSDELMRQAKLGEKVVRGSNTAIARLRLDQNLIRGGIYNPYSDQVR